MLYICVGDSDNVLNDKGRNMTGKGLRSFAIDLLDDEYGINRTSYKVLSDMLYDDDQQDIVDAVKESDSRFYLTRDAADILRQVEVE